MGGRSQTGTGSTSPNKTEPSKTKPNTTGKILRLETGMNKTYLCAHICAASKTPKIGKKGQKLYQRVVTTAIQAEAEANFGVWKYLAEVGYNMRTKPPKALMSDREGRRHRPSSFALGAAKREIEDLGKGDFRIPDITILTIKAAEIIEMRTSGVIDWNRFNPINANIEYLVEIKFGQDKWGNMQYEDYDQIAKGKVRELADTDCSCETRTPPPNGGSKVAAYPPIKNPNPLGSAIFRPATASLAPSKGVPSILGGLGKLISPPSSEVQFYRKLVPLTEYQNMMIPITASVGIAGTFICGTVVLASTAGGVVATAGAIGTSGAVGGGLLITGFATLAYS